MGMAVERIRHQCPQRRYRHQDHPVRQCLQRHCPHSEQRREPQSLPAPQCGQPRHQPCQTPFPIQTQPVVQPYRPPGRQPPFPSRIAPARTAAAPSICSPLLRAVPFFCPSSTPFSSVVPHLFLICSFFIRQLIREMTYLVTRRSEPAPTQHTMFTKMTFTCEPKHSAKCDL